MTAGINDYKASGAENTNSNTNPGTGATFFNSTAAPLTQTVSNMGTDATHYQVKIAAVPYVDGLTLGADYLEIGGQDSGSKLDQKAESGSYYGTYAVGPATIGYSKSFLATKMTEATTDFLESLEATKYSIAFNVNDQLSISYEKEKSAPDAKTAATAMFDLEATGIQAAYTMGGMTLAIAMNDFENARHSENLDVKDTTFSVAMAF